MLIANRESKSLNIYKDHFVHILTIIVSDSYVAQSTRLS